MHAKRKDKSRIWYLISEALFLLLIADGAVNAVIAGLNPRYLSGFASFCWPFSVAVLAAGCFGLHRALHRLSGRQDQVLAGVKRREEACLDWEQRLGAYHAQLMTESSRMKGHDRWWQ